MVRKPDLESILGESGFVAITEMGGFTLEKVPELSLAPETFWTSIFTSSASVGAGSKLSVSTNIVYSVSLTTNSPTLLLLPLQYLQIQFSEFLKPWLQ